MSKTSEHSRPAESRRCVLLVDDDDQVRQMYSLALRTAGFDVVAASTPQQAQYGLEQSRPYAMIELEHNIRQLIRGGRPPLDVVCGQGGAPDRRPPPQAHGLVKARRA